MTAGAVSIVDIDHALIDKGRIVVDLWRHPELERCVGASARRWEVDDDEVGSGVAALQRIEHPVGRTGREERR